MKITKSCLSIVSASLIQGTVFSALDIEGTFVQRDEMGNYAVNPIFQPEIIQQIHYLIKRSYRITDRRDVYDFCHPEQLKHRRSNSFGRKLDPQNRPVSTLKLATTEFHWDKWIVHKPFSGIQGTERLGGLLGAIPLPCSVELDYPGFVSYLPREGLRPPLVVVVFRGSQAKSFQRLGGLFGPSWLTNFSASKGSFPLIKGSEGIAGAQFHDGFLRKYFSAKFNMFSDIEDTLKVIPEEDLANTRIVFTGHSQGAGIALPAALDATYALGKKYFGEGFDNNVTPRFFVYALSGPNSTGDSATKELMYKIVGRDNIIRHNSLFDVVTYACPGKNFDTVFCNAVFGTLAGIATGYHPVGHLAIDDIKSLIVRGFEYNDKSLSDEALETIWKNLSNGYSKAMLRRQLGDCVMKHIRSFYLAVEECSSLLKGAFASDGPYFFACINHYGSSTANLFCTPRVNGEASSRGLEERSHGSSFDPRLPECDLGRCLLRGYNNRKLIFNEVPYENPEQVFDPSLLVSSVQDPDVYISDSEEEI